MTTNFVILFCWHDLMLFLVVLEMISYILKICKLVPSSEKEVLMRKTVKSLVFFIFVIPTLCHFSPHPHYEKALHLFLISPTFSMSH